MRPAEVGERTLVGQFAGEPLTLGAAFLGLALFVVWWFLMRERLVGGDAY